VESKDVKVFFETSGDLWSPVFCSQRSCAIAVSQSVH